MVKKRDSEGSLLLRTRELLLTTEKSYAQIFLETGLQTNWLCKLATERMANPSVNRVQRLYESLSGRKLSV